MDYQEGASGCWDHDDGYGSARKSPALLYQKWERKLYIERESIKVIFHFFLCHCFSSLFTWWCWVEFLCNRRTQHKREREKERSEQRREKWMCCWELCMEVKHVLWGHLKKVVTRNLFQQVPGMNTISHPRSYQTTLNFFHNYFYTFFNTTIKTKQNYANKSSAQNSGV